MAEASQWHQLKMVDTTSATTRTKEHDDKGTPQLWWGHAKENNDEGEQSTRDTRVKVSDECITEEDECGSKVEKDSQSRWFVKNPR